MYHGFGKTFHWQTFIRIIIFVANANERVNRRADVRQFDGAFLPMRSQDRYGLWHWTDIVNDATADAAPPWLSGGRFPQRGRDLRQY